MYRGGGAEVENQFIALHFCYPLRDFSSWPGLNCSTDINKGLALSGSNSRKEKKVCSCVVRMHV